MSELKMISPLLDHMAVDKEIAGHNGRTCYTLRSTSGERFILKCISVPASDSQVRALILSGAYPDEAAVHAYYGRVAADIRSELEIGKKLAASGSFAGAISYQIEPKKSGVGYDVYILYPLYIPLNDFYAHNAMTHLRAVNLGIDLCQEVLNRFETYIMTNAAEGVEYCKRVDSPRCKVLLDTFHMNIEEDNIPAAIRLTGDYLGHIHVGEANRKLPGQGSLDWKAIAAAVHDVHYDGNVVMEPFLLKGGSVGKDIKVWRDLSNGADEAKMDQMLADAVKFLHANFD